MKLYRIALAAWFVLWGLPAVTNLQFQLSGFVLGCLAIAGGVLWLLEK